MDRIFAKLLYEMEKNRDTVLVTIIADKGSTPRGAGSQMLVGTDGRILGTIGGGAVEERAEAMALELIQQKKSACHLFQLHERAKEDIGMVCGGDVKVLFQYIPGNSEAWVALAGTILDRVAKRQPGWLVLKTDGSEPALLDGNGGEILGDTVPGSLTRNGWIPFQSADHFCLPLPIGERAFIFGCGHCAQALAPLLNSVGFRVTVFDEREEYANRENFPTAENIIAGDYTRLADYISFTEDDYIVVMTSGHSYDLEVQDQVLRGGFAYVGVIGSRKKTATVNQRLRDRGVPEEAIARVHTPVGVSIKAVTPEEIAVSITGEMIYVRALRREATGVTVHGCPMH
ncbi:MAG: xanthine dehydrogenase accessory protein XdhC [Oscillospiraceae bacterium]|nr:xanthine dehydrogenase accessory protein XdhC [Oscillospiraceae bacterium]